MARNIFSLSFRQRFSKNPKFVSSLPRFLPHFCQRCTQEFDSPSNSWCSSNHVCKSASLSKQKRREDLAALIDHSIELISVQLYRPVESIFLSNIKSRPFRPETEHLERSALKKNCTSCQFRKSLTDGTFLPLLVGFVMPLNIVFPFKVIILSF